MTPLKIVSRIAGVVLALTLMPAAAAAQSAISGQVVDDTGAVLPGVTVEVASPALIEGSRRSVTDGAGRYSIIDLRPGTYTVTATLTGFNKFVRSDLELPSNFRATVDVVLGVGSLEESVTVSGESPLVDVEQASRSQVLNREVLDSIVTSHSTWTQASLVGGVRMTGNDVGGSQYVSDLLLESHGANARHTTYQIDGMMVNTMANDGRDQNYYQDGFVQEMAVQSSGGRAEVSAGGVLLQLVPQDGGNQFRGKAYLGLSDGSWQSDNLTQELRDAGLQTSGDLIKIFDYSALLGGPIIRNRLWFLESFRYWGSFTTIANVYEDDGSEARNEGWLWNPVTRLTYQATPRNKFSLHFDRQSKNAGPRLQATYPAVLNFQRGTDPETASTWQAGTRPYYVLQTKWTSPISNRWLIEAGFSKSATLATFYPQDGVEAPRGTPEWYSRVRKTDLNTGITWNGALNHTRWFSLRNLVMGSASYVTGSHNIKVGTQLSFGTFARDYFANGDISLIQYRSGVPDSVSVNNDPLHVMPRVNHDIGLYAQDQWKFNRVTLSYGVRVDWLNAQVDEQRAPAGRFVGERLFAEVPNVPDFGPDLSPRLGVAYDVFGNARTALKFSLGKYMTPYTTGLAERLNPMAPVSVAIPWNDSDLGSRPLSTNNDGVAQDNELDLTRLPSNFGERQLDRLDPDLKREYNVETAISLEHALTSRISAAVGWYRRSFHNILLDCLSNTGYRCPDNLERDFSDYVPVEVVSPYNGEIITAYNLRSTSELSLVDNVVTNGKGNKEVYNGYEFAVQTRLPRGGMVLVSSNLQRTVTQDCDQRDDPNRLRFCDRFDLPAPYKGVAYRTDLKIAGSYELPYGIRASGKLTTYPGRRSGDISRVDEDLPINWSISRTTRYTAADCAGRPCTPGALVIPGLVETSLVIPLAPSGTDRRLPRITQLDFAARKRFRIGAADLEAQFDFFNVLNSSTITSYASDNFGTAPFTVPSEILLGRMPRIGLELKW
jgi:hypothetical protein